MIKYSGIGDQMTTGISDQVLRNTQMAYIYVQDVSEALKKAKQHGAQEVKGITQAGEMGRFAIIVDPTGAHVALWESFE
ncbi:hypothetical protein SFC82_14200 [Legionella pneumophila]|nr:hypothetical protein [Legionella pneumophila]